MLRPFLVPSLVCTLVLTWGGPARAQQAQSSSPQPPTALQLSLADAIARAQKLSPDLLNARLQAQTAGEAAVQARALFLPTLAADGQYLYTQGNGLAQPRYIANDAVHAYFAQANAEETLSFRQFYDFRRARAAEAAARARLALAQRGLVATVVEDYFAYSAALRKQDNAHRAEAEATAFLDLSRKLEAGGEVSHADVIKAQIQLGDRQRALREAVLAALRARLDLALFTLDDLDQPLVLTDALDAAKPLPPRESVQALARQGNPALDAAAADLRQTRLAVAAARSDYFPTLTFDYWYGIDAPRFATRVDGLPVLGHSAAVTLHIPLWDWGATHSRVRESQFRRQFSEQQLLLAQRQVQAEVESFYGEASAASQELTTLERNADLAEESLRLTNLRYHAGESTALEVVDAQNTRQAAQDAYVDGQLRYQVALARLQVLTGVF